MIYGLSQYLVIENSTFFISTIGAQKPEANRMEIRYSHRDTKIMREARKKIIVYCALDSHRQAEQNQVEIKVLNKK